VRQEVALDRAVTQVVQHLVQASRELPSAAWACLICATSKFDTPTNRVSPRFTRASMARIVSAIGCWPLHQCTR